MFLVRMIGFVFIGFCLIISAALLLSRQLPEDAATRDLMWCGDRPCVLGLTPNVTAVKDANAILLANPQLEHTGIGTGGTQVIKQASPFYSLEYATNLDKSLVSFVTVIFPPNSPLIVSQVVAKFGVPCLVVPSSKELLLLVYRGMHVYVTNGSGSQAGRFEFAAKVHQINIIDNIQPGLLGCSNITFTKARVRWQGFRKYYLFQPGL